VRSVSVYWRTPFLVLACVCLIAGAVPYQSAHGDISPIDPPVKSTTDSTVTTAPSAPETYTVGLLYLMDLVLITI
jgi:hypothetical protein